jgi:hypothetical protein
MDSRDWVRGEGEQRRRNTVRNGVVREKKTEPRLLLSWVGRGIGVHRLVAYAYPRPRQLVYIENGNHQED